MRTVTCSCEVDCEFTAQLHVLVPLTIPGLNLVPDSLPCGIPVVVNPLHLRVFFRRRVWSHRHVYIKRSAFRASPPRINMLVFFSPTLERPGPFLRS